MQPWDIVIQLHKHPEQEETYLKYVFWQFRNMKQYMALQDDGWQCKEIYFTLINIHMERCACIGQPDMQPDTLHICPKGMGGQLHDNRAGHTASYGGIMVCVCKICGYTGESLCPNKGRKTG